MLESLIKPEVLKHKCHEMFFMAMAIGAVSITLAAMISSGNAASHLGVAFCCIAMAPILVRIIQMEEGKDEEEKAGPFFGGYWTIIKAYSYYFLGIIVIFSLIFALLPDETSAQLFSSQKQELEKIRGKATGKMFSPAKFLIILENNLGVLFLALLFSFVFGAGAIYVITWNASIIAVLIGITAKVGYHGGTPLIPSSIALTSCVGSGGQSLWISYLLALPCSLLALFSHGIFEIGAYFMAGLAGGIISTISISNRIPDEEVLMHTGTLIVLAVLFVAIGAFIEACF